MRGNGSVKPMAAAMAIAVLAACGGEPRDGEVVGSTTTAPTTTNTPATTTAPTTTLDLQVDAEVPDRITGDSDASIILYIFVNMMRREYDPPLSDQELVDAGQAVCSFYDDHRPGAAKDASSLLLIASSILVFGSDDPLYDHPIYETLLAWLADAPRGTAADDAAAQKDALESIGRLAGGSAVSFCPEHRDKLAE